MRKSFILFWQVSQMWLPFGSIVGHPPSPFLFGPGPIQRFGFTTFLVAVLPMAELLSGLVFKTWFLGACFFVRTLVAGCSQAGGAGAATPFSVALRTEELIFWPWFTATDSQTEWRGHHLILVRTVVLLLQNLFAIK